jgi:hypothetical protein
MRVAAHLKQPTRKRARAARCGFRRVLPYLALLPAGFALPSPLPSTRCALTAPFQPYRHACARLGGIFSVALSVGSRPPGVTWRRAMRSPDFPPHSCEYSDCLADSRAQHSALGPAPQAESGGVSFVSFKARAYASARRTPVNPAAAAAAAEGGKYLSRMPSVSSRRAATGSGSAAPSTRTTASPRRISGSPLARCASSPRLPR